MIFLPKERLDFGEENQVEKKGREKIRVKGGKSLFSSLGKRLILGKKGREKSRERVKGGKA